MSSQVDKNELFATTHWSVILQATDSHSPHAAEAMDRLCKAYWYPIYAFLRRQGQNENDAADLTQDFFAHLLEKKRIPAADRQRGRFRTFLIAALKNHVTDLKRRDRALKRGGGELPVSLDVKDATPWRPPTT